MGPDSARDATREPQDRPRPAHRPWAESARRRRADLSDHPSRDLRQSPRRQRGGRATPRPAAPAREKRRLAAAALQPYPRQAALSRCRSQPTSYGRFAHARDQGGDPAELKAILASMIIDEG